MKIQDIKKQLDLLGIQYKNNASKAELEDLLKVSQPSEPAPVEPAPVEPAPVEPAPVEPEEPVKKAENKILGHLGESQQPVVYIGKKVAQNGIEYNEILTVAGVTYMLSDRDMKLQFKPS